VKAENIMNHMVNIIKAAGYAVSCGRGADSAPLIRVLLATICHAGFAQAQPVPQAPVDKAVPVTVDNFNRAETDMYFRTVAKNGGIGHLEHRRGRRSIRRIPRQDSELVADYAGLELHGAALSPAHRNPERHMEIPGGAARELTVSVLPTTWLTALPNFR